MRPDDQELSQLPMLAVDDEEANLLLLRRVPLAGSGVA
jgi:hypothetical protein